MTIVSRTFAAPALLAALSLVATPAAAADLPTSVRHAPVEATASYGPYYGGGWGWGRHRHRGRVNTGDILTGVLILGGIAAVVNAASRNAQQRRDYPYPQREDRRAGPTGLDNAADLCVREIERNARVRDVDRVERSASGWMVSGAMADGAAFTCSIGADGRIDRVDIGGRAQAQAGDDRQYGDDIYRSARAGAEAAPQPMPAYPGGPLPGDESLPEAPADAAAPSGPGA